MLSLFLFSAAVLSSPTHTLDTNDVSGLSKLTSSGLDPARIQDPAALRGLENILSGKAFEGGALPAASVAFGLALTAGPQIRSAMMAGVDNLTASRAYWWKYFGKVPAPNSLNLGPVRIPYSLGNIVQPLATSAFERTEPGAWRPSRFVYVNCFSCHSGLVKGTVIAGAPNTQYDGVSEYLSGKALADTPFIFQSPLLTNLERTRGQDALAYFRSVAAPLGQQYRARGENLGPYSTSAVVARMVDPERRGLQVATAAEPTPIFDDLFLSGARLPTVKSNAWWTLKFRDRAYWYWDAPVRSGKDFALNFTIPTEGVNELYHKRVPMVNEMLAFANQLDAPAYPGTVDENLAEYGRTLFHAERPISTGRTLPCASCHGTYSRNPSGQGWTVDYPRQDNRKNVGTDTAYMEATFRMNRIVPTLTALKNNPLFQAESPEVLYTGMDKPGRYMPPVLVGTWATAPYFHNASVPTIEQVLNSNARPTYWKRSINPLSFNAVSVGVEYEELTADQVKDIRSAAGEDPFSEGALQARRIYDTTDFGKSNHGHTFGDAMTPRERQGVIEFLKALSGPGIQPIRREHSRYFTSTK